MQINHQTYQGPTMNPLADLIDARVEHFAASSRDQMRNLWRKWGLCGAPDRRRAVWNQFEPRERAIFVQAAKLPEHYAAMDWDQLDEHQQGRVWGAIQGAASWSDRVKACTSI